MGIGIRLKELLKLRGLSIRDLSEAAGIPVNTLYSITKRDSERVHPDTLEKISKELNVSVHYLQGRVDDPLPPAPGLVERLDPFGEPYWTTDEAEEHKDKVLNINAHIDRQVGELNVVGKLKVLDYATDLSAQEKYRKKKKDTPDD